MRHWVWIAVLASGVGCSDSASSSDAGVIDAGRVDAAQGTIAPLHGAYSLSWKCDSGCLGGAPFEYFDELLINRDASPFELTYRQSECGPQCDFVDTASLDDPCLSATGIDLGDGTKTDPYSFCPDTGGPSAIVKYRGFPGPEDEKSWFARAQPDNP